MDKQTRLVIETARDVLIGGHWNKGNNAVDSRGLAVSNWEQHACSWCVVGALIEATRFVEGGDLPCRLLAEVSDALIKHLPTKFYNSELEDFNDDTKTKLEDVIALFNRALGA